MKPQDVKSIYRKRAKFYNFTSSLYYLLGVRSNRYRKKGIGLLNLKPGSIVIELGCGTGINFAYVQKHIGPNGKIIGVDLTGAMLEKAKERVKIKKWKNVELVEADAMTFECLIKADAIISTYALTIMPNPKRIIENSIKYLKPKGQMLILDLQVPDNWLSVFSRFFLAITRPYAITKDWINSRYWEVIENTFNDNFNKFHKKNYFFGYMYTIIGQK